MNHELPDVQAGFRKGRGTRDQIAIVRWNVEKAREFQKNIYFCFIDYTKAFDYVDHNKLWKILKEMGITDHFTCLLRNLYAGQEVAVRTRHVIIDRFQIGKGECQCYILSPCLFNLYVKYIMWNAQSGWTTIWNQDYQEKYQQPQICRWYYSHIRKWRTKQLLEEGERGEWKSWLKAQHSKKLRSWHLVPSLHDKLMGKQWKQSKTLFSWAPKSLETVTAAMKLKDACSLEEKLWQI